MWHIFSSCCVPPQWQAERVCLTAMWEGATDQKWVPEQAFRSSSGVMLIKDSWPLLHQFVWIPRDFLNYGRPEDALDMFWHDRQAQPLNWVELGLCPLLVEWEHCTFILTPGWDISIVFISCLQHQSLVLNHFWNPNSLTSTEILILS